MILKPNAVEITQINQARTTETDRTQPGGHGLAYFGKQLESHGGKLETTLHDGEWTLFAYLPIPVPETLPTPCRTPRIVTGSDGREKRKGYFKGCYTDVVHPYLQRCPSPSYLP